MELMQWIKPLGIVTYSMVFLTLVLGVFRKRVKNSFKWHRILGIISFVLASCHAALVILLY
ncbi:MAG: hypothetical protein JW827_03205 [Spirochaetes bacterium]|nr:hypothetical protein [Spirochaetota bacterium]